MCVNGWILTSSGQADKKSAVYKCRTFTLKPTDLVRATDFLPAVDCMKYDGILDCINKNRLQTVCVNEITNN